MKIYDVETAKQWREESAFLELFSDFRKCQNLCVFQNQGAWSLRFCLCGYLFELEGRRMIDHIFCAGGLDADVFICSTKMAEILRNSSTLSEKCLETFQS